MTIGQSAFLTLAFASHLCVWAGALATRSLSNDDAKTALLRWAVIAACNISVIWMGFIATFYL